MTVSLQHRVMVSQSWELSLGEIVTRLTWVYADPIQVAPEARAALD